ncbi:MAG: hypothetical protein JWQ72_2146 [Polaromonas sp.]|nr:hypothetical protein [Polaromonas sp.]
MTALNNPQAVSSATAPRGMVLANGVALQGFTEFEVDNNSFYQADTFRITLCLSAQPAAQGWAFWAAQTDIEVELLVGYPANPLAFAKTDLVSLVVGNVDDIEIDPIRDQVVLSGRDLTARFLDSKTTQKFQEQTVPAIVATLAAAHGLTPVVVDPLAGKKFGSVLNSQSAVVAHDRPEWDVLTYVAQTTGSQVYVKGRELHFEPRTAPSAPPYIVRWQAPNDVHAAPLFNGITLGLQRNLTVSKTVRVTVRSWNYKHPKGFSKVAERVRKYQKSPVRGAATGGPVQQYFYSFPNLTPEQAQQRANALLQEISQHEMNLTVSLPGDPTLNPRVLLQLDGTGTAFDQVFYPASVLHTFRTEGGYETTVRAKNSSPESTVAP